MPAVEGPAATALEGVTVMLTKPSNSLARPVV